MVAPGPLRIPNPSPPELYTSNQYRRDAALIIILREEYDAGDDNLLLPLITDKTYGRALAVRALTSPET
jgi:hypothetical protein